MYPYRVQMELGTKGGWGLFTPGRHYPGHFPHSASYSQATSCNPSQTSRKMSAPKLDSLPLLALELISEYLSYTDARRKSLFSFSLVNKTCCEATIRQRFKRILLFVDGPETLVDEINKWEKLLDKYGFGLVQQMKVCGGIPLKYDDKDIFLAKKPDGAKAHFRHLLNDGDQFLNATSDDHPTHVNIDAEFDPEHYARKSESWKPLADFIPKLSGFRDLAWASSDQIPSSVFDALHRTQARFRLHRFEIRSLGKYNNPSTEIDPYEYSVVTSPRLTHIVSLNTIRSARNPPHYDLSGVVVFHLIEGAALNLEEAWIIADRGTGTCCLQQLSPKSFRFEDPRQKVTKSPTEKFKHLILGTRAGKNSFGFQRSSSQAPKGRLRTLFTTVEAWNEICASCVQRWSERTDFELLEHLQIGLSGDSMHKMVHLKSQGAFKSLRALELSYDRDRYTSSSSTFEAAELMLSVLEPLESLRTHCPINTDIFDAIISRHGANLRVLYFEKIEVMFNSNNIRQIANSCPHLEDIEFNMLRTCGNKEEVEIYKALGSMPRLKRASLTLDLWIYDPKPPPNPENTRATRHLYSEEEVLYFMKLGFLNSPIDEPLARAIFETISTTQAKAQPSSRPRFEGLMIQPHCIWRRDYITFPNEQVFNIAAAMRQTWYCTRDQRDTHPHRLVLTRDARYDNLDYLFKKNLYRHLTPSHGGDAVFAAAWKAAWPHSTGDWPNEWRSPPLTGSEEVNAEGVRAGYERYPNLNPSL
ncbi:unnamed protein product [Periconia digitata]|uniref:Uncharacterized protein n=1 Tax=Periconia digitata TaxID=1303443 RepID=A0A9W4XR95_9PLEO|nr:unnamed protein product [Periconia digitata]